MDLDSIKKPTSEDKEGVWLQYCETLLRTAASLWGMKERKGIEVGWSVHRVALRMIKSDGWHKFWEIQRSIWKTLKYTNHYMGERMERMGNEDINMLWRLDYLQYLVHLYESQGRRRAAHWAQIELVMEQKKVDKVEKEHEEEEKSEGMSEEKEAVVGKDAEEEDNEESCEDEDNLSEEKEEEEAKDAIEEEKAKDAGEEHQEESEGELKWSEDKDNSMETENELEVRKEDKDKHEDEANKNCEVGNAEDLVDEDEVKESAEDESEGELGNDRGTTQEEEVAECVLEERYNRESTPGRLEMLKNMDNWIHGSFYLNTGPIVLGGKRTKTFLGGG